MRKKKITGAITAAIDRLEDSMKALVEKDERGMVNSVWGAAAELEYALFLFSLTQQEEAERSSWKLDSPSKQVEVGPALVSAQDLLKEAKSCIDAGDLGKAHKKTWMARGHLLEVWKRLTTR
ncbi:MAG: hypothetical protein ACE5OW_04245 [Candidatus Bathyarchaeia archaeon]